MSASSFAPGRVEILGNHTDYNGGVVLSAALQLGVTATGDRLPDGRIELSSDGLDGTEKIDRRLGLQPSGKWIDYPLGVAETLALAGAEPGGFSIHFHSTLPSGAGLSSSAALEVATAVLLMKLYPFSLSRLEVAKLCRRAENEFVGVNCGLLDQASSVFGRKDHLVFLDCRSESVTTIPLPSHLGLLVIDSGVKHALVGGEYNERREQCFEAARLLGVDALRDVCLAELEAADLPELVKRRALHVVGENERVFQAIEALKSGDAARLGALMTASHRSSMENFENSTPELDLLVDLANKQKGCLGARLSGGGFGGAIVALVEMQDADRVLFEVKSAYESRTTHHAAGYLCQAGDGALADESEIFGSSPLEALDKRLGGP
jgi:galactokinase